jgi:hypothetical protein
MIKRQLNLRRTIDKRYGINISFSIVLLFCYFEIFL